MRRCILLFSVFAIFLTMCGMSYAENAVEFSAVFVEKDAGKISKGKVYMASDMTRYEVDGSGQIAVTRKDRKVIWLIFPKLKKYVEQPLIEVPERDPGLPQEIDTGDLSREFKGYEMVDSYRLKKFLVTVKYNRGENKDRYYEWYRDNFPVPVKTESMDGQTSYEYLNIKLGRPNPELFSEPKHYKKITIEELSGIETGKN